MARTAGIYPNLLKLDYDNGDQGLGEVSCPGGTDPRAEIAAGAV
ncbi:MAG: hypothetical protein V8Q30_05555 [Acutalibacteraceae bacterium]